MTEEKDFLIHINYIKDELKEIKSDVGEIKKDVKAFNGVKTEVTKTTNDVKWLKNWHNIVLGAISTLAVAVIVLLIRYVIPGK
jgi:hypothetical protein